MIIDGDISGDGLDTKANVLHLNHFMGTNSVCCLLSMLCVQVISFLSPKRPLFQKPR